MRRHNTTSRASLWWSKGDTRDRFPFAVPSSARGSRATRRGGRVTSPRYPRCRVVLRAHAPLKHTRYAAAADERTFIHRRVVGEGGRTTEVVHPLSSARRAHSFTHIYNSLLQFATRFGRSPRRRHSRSALLSRPASQGAVRRRRSAAVLYHPAAPLAFHLDLATSPVHPYEYRHRASSAVRTLK